MKDGRISNLKNDKLKTLGEKMRERFAAVMQEPLPEDMVALLDELELRERAKPKT